MEYRKDIQGLRAIAVLFVFAFHLNANWLPGGFIGVDVFFVISGYIISTIILSKLDKKTFSFLDFYKSRVKRIVPTYYFFLIVTSIIAAFLLAPWDIVSDAFSFRKALFWSTLFSSNTYFGTLDTYFGAASTENPLLHTWTLAVEMQFYLILPLILYFIKRKWIVKLLVCLIVSLFIYSTINIVFFNNKSVVYFSLLARIPEFLLGVLLALLLKNGLSINNSKGIVLNTIGALLLIISAVFINENSSFPGALAILPCLATVMLIIPSQNSIKLFLSNKIMVFIGEISYSLYLWHWSIMAFFRYYNNSYDFTYSEMVIIIMLSIVLSLVSYYFIETPIRKQKGFSTSLQVSSILGAFLILFIFFIPKINNRVTNIKIPVEYLSHSLGITSHAGSPAFKGVEKLGDTARSDKILLIGDSHASCMKPYLDYMGHKYSFSFNTISNSGYPLLPGISESEFENKMLYETYKHAISLAEPEIEKCNILILQYRGDGERWVPVIANLINNLREDQYFILLSDFYTLDKNPLRANRDFIKNVNNNISYKKTLPEPCDEILELINNNNNCYYIDLSRSDVFNDTPFYKDTLMYFDQSHLNSYGSISYAKNTESVFMRTLDSIKTKL